MATIEANSPNITIPNAVNNFGQMTITGSNNLTFGGLYTQSATAAGVAFSTTGTALTTFSGGIDVGNAAVSSAFLPAGSGNILINSTISDSASFEDAVTGTMTLSGFNTFTGHCGCGAHASNSIPSGTVVIVQNNAALGGTGNGIGSQGMTVFSGAASGTPSVGNTLELQGGISLSRNLTLNGTGLSTSGTGALDSNTGANTWTGGITIGSNSTIRVDAGSTLTLTGAGRHHCQSGDRRWLEPYGYF